MMNLDLVVVVVLLIKGYVKMSDWLSGVIGQGIASNLGGTMHNRQQYAAQASQYGLSQGCQNVQQAYAQNQAMAAQQQAAYGAMNMSAGTQAYKPLKWMFNGEYLDFEKFVEKIFPEDTAEKTAFVLKYSE